MYHHDPPSDLVAHTLSTATPAVFNNNAGHTSCPRRNLKKLL